MEEVSLSVPESLLEALPEDGGDVARDVREAVEGWERRINGAIAESEDDREAAQRVAEAVDRMDDRMERYDEFVPELRAWGESPVYALFWRNLYAAMIDQLYEHDEVAERLDWSRDAGPVPHASPPRGPE